MFSYAISNYFYTTTPEVLYVIIFTINSYNLGKYWFNISSD